MHLCNHYPRPFSLLLNFYLCQVALKWPRAFLVSVKVVCVGMHVVWVQWDMFLWFASLSGISHCWPCWYRNGF